MKKFLTSKVVITVLAIITSIVFGYFQNKHRAEISVKDKRINELNKAYNEDEIVIRNLMDREDYYLKKIDSIKKNTNEKSNRVRHYTADSLAWFYSRGQYESGDKGSAK